MTFLITNMPLQLHDEDDTNTIQKMSHVVITIIMFMSTKLR